MQFFIAHHYPLLSLLSNQEYPEGGAYLPPHPNEMHSISPSLSPERGKPPISKLVRSSLLV